MNNNISRMKATCLAMLAVLIAGAEQPDLTKQIELEKEVVIVEKKATKKNRLPTVVPPTEVSAPLKLGFSDRTVLSDVPADIPTMMPYGYRTLHNFSTARGYFVFGGGTAADFTGSAGYRLVDTDNTRLGIWLQHNSTWAATNPTRTVRVGDNEYFGAMEIGDKAKQKFNDNLFGIDLDHNFGFGRLNAAARFHIDQFNYYGGMKSNLRTPADIGTTVIPTHDWNSFKQNYTAAELSAGWDGTIEQSANALDYHACVDFGYAGYSKALSIFNDKGAREVDIKLNLGAAYTFNDVHGVSLDITAEHNNFNNRAKTTATGIDTEFNKLGKWLLTVAPRYRYTGGNVTLRAGVNIDITNNDAEIYRGAPKVRFSPQLDFDAALGRGLGFFATVWGGRSMGRISEFHDIYRYYNPNTVLATNFTPVDARVGFNIGPFAGFSARLYGGYGMTKLDNNAGRTWLACTVDHEYDMSVCNALYGGAIENIVADYAGMYFGAELNYKYRSLLEASVKVMYAPQDDDFDGGHGYIDPLSLSIAPFLNRSGKFYSGYTIDEYGSGFVANIDVAAHPVNKLTVNLGLDVRTDRGYFLPALQSSAMGSVVFAEGLDNIINLRAGARWQFNKTLAVWLNGDNLLGKRYDLFVPGMGSQRFAVMGGIALNF